MISVTQPRRPADDFLASLQSNLQGNTRTRRKRGPQKTGINEVVQKSKAPAKVSTRARPPLQQSKLRSDVKDVQRVPKKSGKPSKAVKSSSPEVKPSCNDQNSRSSVAHSNPDVQVEVIDSPSLQQPAPVIHFQPQAPPVEVVQNSPSQYNNQHTVPPQPEDPLQNVRSSKNNFYMKNQSNIFNTGFNPYQVPGAMQQAVRSSVADKIVVENALRIASQQPLPATPSFSHPRGNVRQELTTSQHSMPNNSVPHYQVSNNSVPHYQETRNVSQPPIVIRPHHQSNIFHNDTGQQQTATINEGKPINSHYTQSFSITGGTQHDSRTTQEAERQKWIQELEAQVREKKERDRLEKMRDKSPYPPPLPTGQRSSVPNYQPPPTHNIPVNYPPNVPQQQPHSYTAHQPPTLPAHSHQVPVNPSPQTYQPSPNLPVPPNQPPGTLPLQPPATLPVHNYHSAVPSNSLHPPQQIPTSNLQSPQVTDLSPQSNQPTHSPTQGRMLGQHAWVDPVEMERRQEARKRALENQEMIRKQVEERERQKKEERERIKREEEVEMRRIEEEKRRMAEEVRLEQETRRKKEEAQLQQIAEMRRKIEEANKSAREEKHSKIRSRSAVGNVQPEKSENEKSMNKSHNAGNNAPKLDTVQENLQTLADVAPVKETSSTPVQHPAPAPRPPPTLQPAPVQPAPVQPAPVQVLTPVVEQSVKYVSNAATQTVHEVSCQTMSRENSVLPAESKLIRIPDRELSVVQRNQSANRNSAKNNTVTKRNSNKKIDNKSKSTSKVQVKRQQTQKIPEVPKFQYDNNGRRIRPKVEKPPPPSPPPPPAKLDTPPPRNIIAEESEPITNYKTIADIFDDPGSPKMVLESVGPSPFTVPDQQVQMRYKSPKNEERSIPSAISARQNDILCQLEKLRMGLRDRRRHLSSAEINIH